MGALSWLMNMSFAGGGEAVIPVIPPEFIVRNAVLMTSIGRIADRKKKKKNFKLFDNKTLDSKQQKKKFVSDSVFERLFKDDNRVIYDFQLSGVPVLSSLLLKKQEISKEPEFQKVEVVDNKFEKSAIIPSRTKIKSRTRNKNFKDKLDEIISYRMSKRNKKRQANYFEINSRHKTVSLF